MPGVDRRMLLRYAGLGAAACVLAPVGIVLYGWLSFVRLENSVSEKMDQYYLNITTPGREEYLLAFDPDFEVPYMASKRSVEAVPTRIFDRSGALIGEYISEKGVYVRAPEDLPAFLKKALVATEDRRFYEHHGINWKAVARAAFVNLRSLRGKQGGSTLTQQLAKLMFTTRRKTMGRKVFEFFCARKLEQKFTKDQILLMYFNFVYFGHGCWGVESASQFYFGKPARELRIGEAAMLAGIIASPNNYSPHINLELAKARHHTVLKRMAEVGFLPAASVESYEAEFWQSMEGRLRVPEVSFWRMRVNEAPYFIEEVRRALEKDFSKDDILKGGLRIETTLDLSVQRAAQDALRRGLAEENRLSAAAAQDEEERAAPVEGALAAVDPADGAILAVVGGSAFNYRNQLNRALDIHRPIGSSIKPFVYASAFETGAFKPEDTLLDAPVTYKIGGGRTWSPHNYDGKYHGSVRLDAALAKSLNMVAIKVLERLDLGSVISLLVKATGREAKNFPRNLSLALGTADLSPVELAGAYALFVNGGRPVRPYYLRRILDRDGKTLKEGGPLPALDPALSTGTCKTMLRVLQGVLQEGGSAFPAVARTGFTIPAAGKTGTTSDYRDAWFAGVTPDISAAVWIGHDDMRVALSRGRAGGIVAAPIWMNFLKDVYRTRPTREFDKITPP